MNLSIRSQMLLVFGAIVVAALGASTALATALFTNDKLAYVYDLNSSVTATVSEEVRAGVASLVDKLLYFGAEQSGAPAADADRHARSFFATDPDVLSIEIWEKQGTGYRRSYRYVDPARLAALNLTAEDLAASRRAQPLRPEVVAAEEVILANASVAPDVALLTLAAASPGAERIVAAELRPDRLLRIFGRSPLYRVYLVDGRGSIVAHPDPAKVIARESALAVPVVRDAVEGSLSRGAREFATPAGTLLGAFSRVGLGQLAVIAEVPREEALKATRELVRKSELFALAIVLVALLASIYFSRLLTAPLLRLQQAADAVGRGDFAVQVPATTGNEIGALGAAFNRMSRELLDREARLGEAHSQLTQAEKLSVLGEMSASIAHEVKNPLVGIVGFAQMGQVAEKDDEKLEYFQLIEKFAWRADEIVKNLLKFARSENVELEPLDPNTVVQSAMQLVAHQMQMRKVRVEVSLGTGLPRISGSPGQLQQVLINLMVNGQQAMEHSAERVLTLGTALSGTKVLLTVRDRGSGMTDEVRLKLFRPFFTTKAQGKGTGLGLSVSQRIVRQHGGEITVESAPDKGTTFTVNLPAMAADVLPPPVASAS